MGKIHTNYLESSHSTLIQLKSKDLPLKKEHYILSTNLGLLQANMTYMYEKTEGYNWITELYQNTNFPLYKHLVTSCTEYSHTRYKEQQALKTEALVWKHRKQNKKHREIEQAERQKFMAQLKKVSGILHDYGNQFESKNVSDAKKIKTKLLKQVRDIKIS